jgi:hypothetical protein
VCQTVVIGKYEIGGMKRLCQFVPRRVVRPLAKVPEHRFRQWLAQDWCLCGLDLEALGRAAGYEIEEHDGDPMQVRWR